MSDRSRPTDEPEVIPARMINEFVYCPRLAYLEWIDGEWAESADTVSGTMEHRRVDRGGGRVHPPNVSANDANDESDTDDLDVVAWHARGVWVTSERLRLTAKVDLIEGDGGDVTPVESKHGRAPERGGVWPADRVQVGAQCLILEDLGYRVTRGIVYYRSSKRRVEVPLDDVLRRDVVAAADGLRALTRASVPPPPLVDSPKCPGCSLVGICMPDEVNLLSTRSQATGEEEDPAEPPLRRLLPPNADRLPLFVQTAGARIGISGDVLEVTDPDGGRTRVRMLDTSHVCVLGNVQVSAQATRALLEAGIPISWFSYGGWYLGTATPLVSGTGRARHAQHLLAADAERSLAVSRGLVARKIRNARTLLRRNSGVEPTSALAELQRLAKQAVSASSAASLLGIEGLAARAYYAAFTGMLSNGVDLAFDWNGRNRRPPADPINALLSLGYSMLAKDWTATLFAIGLDPHVGVFHRMRAGKPALALDLMEEFRPLVADSVVLQVINNGEVRARDFVQRGPACNLTSEGRKRFLRAYERRMDHEIRHPLFGYKLAYRQLFEVQARLFARTATGEIDEYPGFETR